MSRRQKATPVAGDRGAVTRQALLERLRARLQKRDVPRLKMAAILALIVVVIAGA